VLNRAKHRTKRELARLVRALDPLPAVPARIEPLGPAPARLIPETPMSHAHPQATLEEIHLCALRALVSELTKKKYAANEPRLPREPRSGPVSTHDAPIVPHHPRQRGRHIPAAVRRAVFERDGNQCTYVAATGRRCAETRRLEFHHLVPFATGGAHDVSNLTLWCAAHNALAAEQDFGRELVEERRSSGREHDAAIREELHQPTLDRSDDR
jgi:5-methylcytosine-specific restriction endonuclease McrA